MHTPLEAEAVALLRSLCHDRGVILHAACCVDSREAFQDLCRRHGVSPEEKLSTGGHVVLLGDSILDNASYVSPGYSVREQLEGVLPPGWQVTLLAVDGARMADVKRQLSRLPSDATHLVLSVGGNDVLAQSWNILSTPATRVSQALEHLGSVRSDFATEYLDVLYRLRAASLPLTVCTIYDAVPELGLAEKTGLAVFNDAISRHAASVGASLIDLRAICNDPRDYSDVSPIEPSEAGGRKISRAIEVAVRVPEGFVVGLASLQSTGRLPASSTSQE